MTIFAELGLNKTLQANVESIGYKSPTKIQRESIGAVLSGADTYAIAPTGTGKTAAYLLPTLQELSQEDHTSDEVRPIRALYLVPTRDLAQQLEASIAKYGKDLKLRTITLFGGVRIESQTKRFKRGADIIIATPKRLTDMLKQKTFNLDNIKHFIMDEADRLVSMGIQQELNTILSALPNKKQMVLFSATDSKALAKFADKNLSHEKKITASKSQQDQSNIVHTMYRCFRDDKPSHLLDLIKLLDCDKALIFTRTKNDVAELTQLLEDNNLSCEGIHNEVPQKYRESGLKSFKDGDIKFLVATDVISRGIDIDQLFYVINYDLPVNSNDYIHRAGRTARKSTSPISSNEKQLLQSLSSQVVESSQFQYSEAPKINYKKLQGHVFSFVSSEQERLVPKIANALDQDLQLLPTPW